jgi:enoyl-CoA hydratase/carnithine racemase
MSPARVGAVGKALRDRGVKAIALQGADRSFCAGFSFADD